MYEKRERVLDTETTITFGDCIVENTSKNKDHFNEDETNKVDNSASIVVQEGWSLEIFNLGILASLGCFA